MASIRSTLIRFLLRRSNIWNKSLAETRESMAKMKARGIPGDVKTSTDNINVVSCEVFTPTDAPKGKAIIYFHGGGFCLGIYDTNREFVARLAKETGITVFMPDYRLAPENPFPAALEDAVAVYKGLVEKNYSPEDMVIIADSSGCALAISALLVLKQDNRTMPKALAFITPVFDLAGNGDTFTTRAAKDPFKLKDPLSIAKIYVGMNNPATPMISPLYGELKGLPPMLIHAADYDVFLSDADRFSEMSRNAGVSVDLKVWSKMWHIFHMQEFIVPESKKAFIELCEYARTSLDR